MKNVGILTFHDGTNYGAALQCYALQRILKDKGTNVEVINFKKEKVYSDSKSKYAKFLSKAYMARKLYAIPYTKQLKKKEQNFNQFFKNNFAFGTEKIITESNISDNVKKYDSIIFGSDQIWNFDPKIYDRSKVFFGDFDYSGEKISYAASFGDSISYAKNHIDYIKDKLSKFKAISVREQSGCEFLKNNGLDASVAVDPTMLLSTEEWEKLVKKERIIKEKYILYYSVNCRKYSWKVAKELSSKTGLKVINLVEHPKIIGSGFKNYYFAGPIEFLNIIKNAEYVVTNSFHGTIFSILFKKKFIPVFDSKDGKFIKEERKYSILEAAGLLDLITTLDNFNDVAIYENIDYKKASEKLDVVINKSIHFLEKNCGDLSD